jgi:hypothetical protein
MLEVLRRSVESTLTALVRVDDGPVGWVSLADGHAERVGDERGVLGRVDRPADGVLGDVGDPEAVRVVAGEVTVDEVAGGGLVGDAPVLRSAGQALQAGLAHQQPHGFGADREAVAEG